MGAAWVDWKTDGKSKSHFRNFAFAAWKKEFSASNCYWRWEVNIFRESQTQKVVAFTWRSINIDGTAKSLRKEDNAQFEPCIARKTARMRDTRHERVILQHDNAPCHRTSIIQDTIKTLKLDLLPHPLYSPDLAPSDYHLFRSMAHGLAGLHLANFEEVQNELDEWFQFKDASFYRRGIHYCQRDGKNV